MPMPFYYLSIVFSCIFSYTHRRRRCLCHSIQRSLLHGSLSRNPHRPFRWWTVITRWALQHWFRCCRLGSAQLDMSPSWTILQGVPKLWLQNSSRRIPRHVPRWMSTVWRCVDRTFQGGSIATIAAIQLMIDRSNTSNTTTMTDSWNPYVITFGAPHGLGAACLQLVNTLAPKSNDDNNNNYSSWRWYHFIMSVPASWGLTYDAVPMIFPHLLQSVASYADQGFAYIGHELFLSSDDTTSMVYTGKDQHRFGMPYTGNAHFDWHYSSVLEEMMDTATSIPTTDFTDGSLCNEDIECESGLCQRDFFQVKSKCHRTIIIEKQKQSMELNNSRPLWYFFIATLDATRANKMRRLLSWPGLMVCINRLV